MTEFVLKKVSESVRRKLVFDCASSFRILKKAMPLFSSFFRALAAPPGQIAALIIFCHLYNVKGTELAFAGQATQQRKTPAWVLQNYSFPTQVNELNPEINPVGWPSAKSEPARALTLGAASQVLRAPVAIESALFVPRQLTLIRGSGDAVQLYNMMLTMWQRDELEQIENLMGSNIDRVRKIPRASLERRNFYLLRGHFFFIKWLNLMKTDEKQAEISRLRSMGAYNEAFGFADMGALFDGNEPSMDGRFLRKSLELAYVPSLKMMTKDDKVFHVKAKNYTPEILPESVSPLKNIRNNSLPVTWNLVAMLSKDGDWQKAFNAAQAFNGIFDKIGPRAPHFAGELGEPVMKAFDVSKVSSPIVLLPRKRKDMNASLFLMQASAYLLDRDGVNALIMADKAIRSAESNSLKAAGMNLAGNIYFDMGQKKIARDIYSWSKILSEEYADRDPSLIFFLAESNFWLGNFDGAYEGFEEFLQRVGDKNYGPWAKLRLALMKHRRKEYTLAWTEYEKIYRFHPKHDAALDASVRLFCLSERGIVNKSLKQRLEQVLREVENGRLGLQEQAQACALESRMAIASEPWQHLRDRNALFESAQQIRKPLHEFREEYPESAYLSLYAKKERQMNLMRGKAILETENCKDIIAFYEREGSALFSKEIGEAMWNAVEKKRLMRCTAIIDNFSLWDKGIKEHWEPATSEIQSALLSYARNSSSKNFTRLKRSVIESGSELEKLARQREKISDSLLLRVPEFWFLIAAHRIYLRELSQNKVAPSSVASQFDSCLEKSQALDSSKTSHVEKVLLSYPSSWWIDNFLVINGKNLQKESKLETKTEEKSAQKSTQKSTSESAEGSEQNSKLESVVETEPKEEKLTVAAPSVLSRCEQLLVDKMFELTRRGTVRSLAAQLWLPYLEKLGVNQGGEEWLEYAYYLERVLGADHKDTIAVFQKIFKDSQNTLPKETAGIWLESNAKSGQTNW